MAKPEEIEAIRKAKEMYCPICQKNLYPTNIEEVIEGEHDGFIYLHDDIDHEESDIDALFNGIN